jgi:hypothetical protein
MFLFLLAGAACRSQDGTHVLTGYCNIVTSAQVFTNPSARDPVERNATNAIGAMLSGSVQYGIAVSSVARLQASFEYVAGSDASYDNYNTETIDGFRMYGIELTGVFLLPVSGERFLLYLGGGGGGYWGTREYAIGELASRASSSNMSFGILTIFGLEYRVFPPLSLKTELRFRDPQIDTQNVFDRATLDVRGITYHLPTQPFASKVNVDGNVYSIGLSWSF